jgi:hypothetical protein
MGAVADLPEGAVVTVDGDTGQVTIDEEGPDMEGHDRGEPT